MASRELDARAFKLSRPVGGRTVGEKVECKKFCASADNKGRVVRRWIKAADGFCNSAALDNKVGDDAKERLRRGRQAGEMTKTSAIQPLQLHLPWLGDMPNWGRGSQARSSHRAQAHSKSGSALLSELAPQCETVGKGDWVWRRNRFPAAQT